MSASLSGELSGIVGKKRIHRFFPAVRIPDVAAGARERIGHLGGRSRFDIAEPDI